MSTYKLLFATEMAQFSLNKTCLFKDKESYIFVDFTETEHYLALGYKESPNDFIEPEEEVAPVQEKVKAKKPVAPLVVEDKEEIKEDTNV